MAYISANLHLIPQAGNRLNAWIYEGTDAYATVAGAGYISDAKDRGMNVGDTVTLTIERNGKQMTLPVVLGKRPATD